MYGCLYSQMDILTPTPPSFHIFGCPAPWPFCWPLGWPFSQAFTPKLSIKKELAHLQPFINTSEEIFSLFFGFQTVGFPAIQLNGNMDLWMTSLPHFQSSILPSFQVVGFPAFHPCCEEEGSILFTAVYKRKRRLFSIGKWLSPRKDLRC